MLKLQNKSVDVEEFALEYIKYDALIRRSNRKNKYRRVLAYRSLARRLGVCPRQALALEQQFRRHVRAEMRRLAADELPAELFWRARVGDCPRPPGAGALQGAGGGGVRGGGGGVLRALCGAARLRGAHADPRVCGAVRSALRLAASEQRLEAAWETAKRLSLEYLSASSRAGDVCGGGGGGEWILPVADVVLLYSDVEQCRVLADEREQLDAEARMLAVLWQLVQKHRLEQAEGRARRWGRALAEYRAGGRVSSLVVLQRRWHEMCARARYKLRNYWRTTSTPAPPGPASHDRPACADPPNELHIAILKRYPHIVTSRLPSWRELVEKDLIITKPVDDVTEERRTEVTANRTTCVTITSRRRASRRRTDAVYPQPLSKRIKSEPGDELDLGHVYSSNVPCAVKQESDVMDTAYNIVINNIKTEVDDENENHTYLDSYKAEYTMKRDARINSELTANDADAYQVEVNVSLKEEPQETGSKSPIVFSDDDVTDDDDDAEDSFDTKLLLEPRVELTRMDNEALFLQGNYEGLGSRVKVEVESDGDTDYAAGKKIPVKREMNNEHSDEAQCAGGRVAHNNKLYILQQVPRPALFNGMVEPESEEPGTITAAQLQLLLQELSDIAMVNQVLRRTQGPCCAARKHFDIDDARARLGLPPQPQHTHEDGAACTCCCGSRVRRRDLDADLRALQRDLELLAAPHAPLAAPHAHLAASHALHAPQDNDHQTGKDKIVTQDSVVVESKEKESLSSPTRTRTLLKVQRDLPESAQAMRVMPKPRNPNNSITFTSNKSIAQEEHLRGPILVPQTLLPPKSEGIRVKIKCNNTLAHSELMMKEMPINLEIRCEETPLPGRQTHSTIPIHVQLRYNEKLISEIVVTNEEPLYVELKCNKQTIPGTQTQHETPIQVALNKVPEYNTTLRVGNPFYVYLKCTKKTSNILSPKEIVLCVEVMCDVILVCKEEVRNETPLQIEVKHVGMPVNEMPVQNKSLINTAPVQYETQVNDTFTCNKTQVQNTVLNTLQPYIPQTLYEIEPSEADPVQNTHKHKVGTENFQNSLTFVTLQQLANNALNSKRQTLNKSTKSEASNDRFHRPEESEQLHQKANQNDDYHSSLHRQLNLNPNIKSLCNNIPGKAMTDVDLPYYSEKTLSETEKAFDKTEKVGHIEHELETATVSSEKRAISTDTEDAKQTPSMIVLSRIREPCCGEKHTERETTKQYALTDMSTTMPLIYSIQKSELDSDLTFRRQHSLPSLESECNLRTISVNSEIVTQEQLNRISCDAGDKTQMISPEQVSTSFLEDLEKLNRGKCTSEPSMSHLRSHLKLNGNENMAPRRSSEPILDCNLHLKNEAINDTNKAAYRKWSTPRNDIWAQCLTIKTTDKLLQKSEFKKEQNSLREKVGLQKSSYVDLDMPLIDDFTLIEKKSSVRVNLDQLQHATEQDNVLPKNTSSVFSTKSLEMPPTQCLSQLTGEVRTIDQRRNSDGIRKSLKFRIPSSCPGKNSIINCPVTENHQKYDEIDVIQKDLYLDPVRLIPRTFSLSDVLKTDLCLKQKSTSRGESNCAKTSNLKNSDQRLKWQEIPVIPETTYSIQSKPLFAKSLARHVAPPSVDFKNQIESHSQNFVVPETKTDQLTSLKNRIREKWLQKFVSKPAKHRRRKSVPNYSEAVPSKLPLAVSTSLNKLEAKDMPFISQTFKILEKRSSEVRIHPWSGGILNPQLVERPLICDDNKQVDFDLLTDQISKESAKVKLPRIKQSTKKSNKRKQRSGRVNVKPTKTYKRRHSQVTNSLTANKKKCAAKMARTRLDTPDATSESCVNSSFITSKQTCSQTTVTKGSPIFTLQVAPVPTCTETTCKKTEFNNTDENLLLPSPASQSVVQDLSKKSEINTSVPASSEMLSKTEIVCLVPEGIDIEPKLNTLRKSNTSPNSVLQCSGSNTQHQEDIQPKGLVENQEPNAYDRTGLLRMAIPGLENVGTASPETPSMTSNLQTPLDLSTEKQIRTRKSILDKFQQTRLNPMIFDNRNVRYVNAIQGHSSNGGECVVDLPDPFLIVVGKDSLNNLPSPKKLSNPVPTSRNLGESGIHFPERNERSNGLYDESPKIESGVNIIQNVIVKMQQTMTATSETVVNDIFYHTHSLTPKNKWCIREHSLSDINSPLQTGPIDLSKNVANESNYNMAEESTVLDINQQDARPTYSESPLPAIINPESLDIETEGFWDDVTNIPLPGESPLIYNILVDDIPLPSEDCNGVSDVINNEDVPPNQFTSPLVQTSVDDKPSLPSIFIYNPEAPVSLESDLPIDIVILRIDKSVIPLAVLDEFVIITEEVIPCRNPSYYTLAPYHNVVEVIIPNYKYNKETEMQINNNKNVDNKNVVNVNCVGESHEKAGTVSANYDIVEEGMVIDENIPPATTPRRRILSVISSADCFRELAHSEAKMWILETSSGQAVPLDRIHHEHYQELIAEVDEEVLMELVSQLHRDGA